MSTLAVEVEPLAVDARCTESSWRVRLVDGREISVPLAWSLRLLAATPEQRTRGA